MVAENIDQKIRFKNIEKTQYYFIKELDQNELMSKRHKKVSMVLNYVEHFLILASPVTGCISILCFLFFAWYSYRNYVFCNRIKKLCGKCMN